MLETSHFQDVSGCNSLHVGSLSDHTYFLFLFIATIAVAQKSQYYCPNNTTTPKSCGTGLLWPPFEGLYS